MFGHADVGLHSAGRERRGVPQLRRADGGSAGDAVRQVRRVPSRGGTIRIVRLRPHDQSTLERANVLFDDPVDLKAARLYLREPHNLFLLALHHDRPVGFLRGTSLGQIHTHRRQFFLYEIAVTRGFRRRGIGRSLVRRMLSIARRQRFDEVFVITSPANRAAVGLYRSTGGRTETRSDRMYVYRVAPVTSAPGPGPPRRMRSTPR